ncbi:hypothetical protein [Snodgrassella sp. CFCC 13594]|uniref:hypothetical protein n=1 Tax=Snodgrassella sp. CFCC 13594 TaxID=1775559 RepID=UPI000ABCD7E4|nr:hypothetical protein [Snodgrassella sp. CFCC 13594]
MLAAWIFLGMLVGGAVGSYVPELWGDAGFSLASVLLGAVGALIGIGLAVKVDERMGM